jgi:hypothetical protein
MNNFVSAGQPEPAHAAVIGVRCQQHESRVNAVGYTSRGRTGQWLVIGVGAADATSGQCKSYEVQTKNGGGWTPTGIFTQARRITLPGLTPGQVYSVQSRAIGGAIGYSDWNGPMVI